MNYLQILAIICVSIVLICIISCITKIVFDLFRKNNENYRLVYVAGIGGIFALLIVSLSVLVFNGGNAIKGNAEVGTYVSIITLCLSLSAIIPFFVTKALTEMDISKMIDKEIKPKIKETYESLDNAVVQVDKAVVQAEGKISFYDSDLSRMISFLMIQKTPDPIWSLSWACRALKSMINAKGKNAVLEKRSYNSLYIAQCLSIIAANLETLKNQKSIQKYFADYDTRFENFYTMGLAGTDDVLTTREKIENKKTLVRLLRDMISLYGLLGKGETLNVLNDYGIINSKDDLKLNTIKSLSEWLIYNMSIYLKLYDNNNVTTLNEEFRKMSYALQDECLQELQSSLEQAIQCGQMIDVSKLQENPFPKIP